MSEIETFKLDELAAQAGTTPRTVRYYVQRGLLPAPPFRGKDTAYGREHLVRLRAIRRLQERFLPLDAIQAELAALSAAELEALANGVTAVAAAQRVHAAPSETHPYRSAAGPAPAERWTKWELAPGLELELAEGAPEDVRALAEEIRERITQKRGARR